MFPSRIVFVISALASGGAERVATLLTSAWAAQGREVTLITTFLSEREPDFYPLSPLVHRVRLADHVGPRRRSWRDNLRRFLTFRRLITEQRPDLVISFMDRVNVLTLMSLLGSGLPVVVCERTNPFQQHLGFLLGWLRCLTYRYLSHAVVSQTERITQRLRREWAVEAVTLANPLTPWLAVPISSISRREKLILCVGRMTSEKGHDLLLQAWAQLALVYPNWRLRLVGDGELKHQLEDLAVQLQLTGRIEWVGRVHEIDSEYQQAQIFVLPSRYEGFPNALLEAMAFGCACLASDCESGPGEMIRHGENGLLCEPNNVNAMTGALQTLLEDASLRQCLGGNAQLVRETFSLNRHLEEWEILFRS